MNPVNLTLAAVAALAAAGATKRRGSFSRFFRIQPAGLGISHLSEDSSGMATCLHVFNDAVSLWNLDVDISHYGDEIVIIEAPHYWDHGDVEGVAINPDAAMLVERLTIPEFVARYAPGWAEAVADDLECDIFDLDNDDLLTHRAGCKTVDDFIQPL
jgi:hypothetical protein